MDDQKVHVTFFQAEKSRLEILEPTQEDSPVAKFLSERGGGIQHIALEVDDIDAWLDALKNRVFSSLIQNLEKVHTTLA